MVHSTRQGGARPDSTPITPEQQFTKESFAVKLVILGNKKLPMLWETGGS